MQRVVRWKWCIRFLKDRAFHLIVTVAIYGKLLGTLVL